MAYATQAQLELWMAAPSLAQCCDDTTEGTADAAVVTDVLDRAAGLMDGFLQTAGYTVPRTGAGVTVALRHWCCAIAAHLAAQRRPEFRDAQGVAPYRQAWLDAMAWLQKVADRAIRLEGDEPEGAGGASLADRPGGMVLHSYRAQARPPAPPRRMRGW
jgi:phage gp36-like protein